MKEQKHVKNPRGMLLMTGIVILLVLYLEWKVIYSYIQGGEGAASLTLVIVSSILMLAGCVFVGWLAIRLYKQAKEAEAEVPEAEITPASGEEDEAANSGEDVPGEEAAAEETPAEGTKEDGQNDPKL